MSELTFRSAGVSARTIDLTGPTNIEPQGIPAGVIGTSIKGPAFVPTVVATTQDFNVKFGNPSDDAYNGPLAVSEWLANQQSALFVRVLGAGTGERRLASGNTAGSVASAGFLVGEEQPQNSLGGAFGTNQFANAGGVPGRLSFLACAMSQSVGSNIFSEAGISENGTGIIVRGVILAASGVIPRLSSSFAPDNNPSSSDVAGTTFTGAITGSVNLTDGRQEFVMLLNGHKGTDPLYPNVLTASFDVTQPNYFVNVFNTDPLKLEEAGYVVYAEYPIHPALAVVTGSEIIDDAFGASAQGGFEQIAFLVTGSNDRNVGSTTVPNFENFEDRFTHAHTPWIISQDFGGAPQNLFRLHAIDSGQYPNNRIKFSIENITPGTDSRPYGTFDLLIREMNDTDKNRSVVEAFRSVNLDPSSDRYIAKAIGDEHTFFNFDASEGRQNIVTDGDYPNRSNFVRVEMSEAVEAGQIDNTALPFGFRGPAHLVTSGSVVAGISDASVYTDTTPLVKLVEVPVPYRQNLNLGVTPNQTVDKGLYWGVQFTRKTNSTEVNASTTQESSIVSYARYFPNFSLGNMNVVVENNEGTPDTVANGVLDADRFNNNLFSLSKVQIVRDEITDIPNTNQLTGWSYVRDGSILTSGSQRSLRTTDLSDSTVRQVAKFSFFMQGGFDGVNIFNQNEKNLTNFAIQEEMNNVNRGIVNGPTVKAYDKAVDVIADTTEVDIQLLAIPGIRHSIITDKALLTTEARFDAVYLMDIDQYDVSNALISDTDQITSVRFTANNFINRGLNSSFGCVYFPDVNLRDSVGGTVRTVAPSVAVLGAFALNDALGHPWFAPAGFSRGALSRVTDSALNLNRNNMDALQEAKINPLVSFAGSNGVTVWGQKTLMATESALERVNVRRLLIDIRRKVKRVADRIVFEQNRAATLERFEQLVKPILKNVQDQSGVERYLVKIDTETTTQADIQNRTIRGKIFIQPTRTLEFLSVDFVLTNNG
jgi:hypothetical protein